MMDKKQALSYYERFLGEVNEQASDEVKKSYKTYQEAFEEYLCAVQEDMFQQAFRYGYEQGLKAARKNSIEIAGGGQEVAG